MRRLHFQLLSFFYVFFIRQLVFSDSCPSQTLLGCPGSYALCQLSFSTLFCFVRLFTILCAQFLFSHLQQLSRVVIPLAPAVASFKGHSRSFFTIFCTSKPVNFVSFKCSFFYFFYFLFFFLCHVTLVYGVRGFEDVYAHMWHIS